MSARLAPLILALAALVLSIYTLVGARATPGEADRTAGAKSAGATPIIDPWLVQGCDGEGSVMDLKDMMKLRVNPMLTRISFALYHNKDADTAERLALVGETSAKLLGCIGRMPTFPPEVQVDRMPEYFRLLDDLHGHTLALQVSAMEADEEGARHWFRHMKQSCFACHARFRTEGAVE